MTALANELQTTFQTCGAWICIDIGPLASAQIGIVHAVTGALASTMGTTSQDCTTSCC